MCHISDYSQISNKELKGYAKNICNPYVSQNIDVRSVSKYMFWNEVD